MNWLLAFFIFLSSLILYIIYNLVIKPKQAIKFFTDQGAIGQYVPIVGSVGKSIAEVSKTGDFLGEYKKQLNTSKVRMFATNFGSSPFVLLVDPALIKEFLLKQEHYYIKDEVATGLIGLLIPQGLVTSEGKVWKKHRKAISSAFHFNFIRDSGPIIAKIAEEAFAEICAGNMNEVNLIEEFQKITGRITSTLFFGGGFEKLTYNGMPISLALADVLGKLNTSQTSPEVLALGSRFFKAGILPKHKKILNEVREIRNVCQQAIQNKKKQRAENAKSGKEATKSLLDILLDYQGNNNEDSLLDEEILDEFLTLYAAGTDTTGHLLGMAAYYLTQSPKSYKKTLNEAASVLKTEQDLDYAGAEKMNYMSAVLKEALRIAPPAPIIFSRYSITDHTLGDIKVPKGTVLNIFPTINSVIDEFAENPEEFVPERWLPDGDAVKKTAQEPYSYLPFSSGPRNCVGQHLAIFEAKLILGMFLNKFEMIVPEGYIMKRNLKFLYEPLDPFIIKLVVKA